MSEIQIVAYTTWGSVRGLGPVRRTKVEAEADRAEDAEGCRRASTGYSDRLVYAVDHEGYVVHRGANSLGGGWRNVYANGRGHAALRVDLSTVRP